MPVLTQQKSLTPTNPDEVFQSLIQKMDSKAQSSHTNSLSQRTRLQTLPEELQSSYLPPADRENTSNPSQIAIPLDSLMPQATLTNSTDRDISATLSVMGVKPIQSVSPNDPNKSFLAELNACHATPKTVAMQLSGLMHNSNSDSVKLQCMKIIMAINGIAFAEDRTTTSLPQINIVLNNGVEDRRIASMLNPKVSF
jgi:hypothetical protein